MRPHRRQPTRLPCPWNSPGKNTGVGCHFLLQCMKVKSESEVAQLCPTFSDPMDCSLPGSSIHGIFQARVLEWVAIAFSELFLYDFLKTFFPHIYRTHLYLLLYTELYIWLFDHHPAMSKPLTIWITTNCRKFLKRWEYQTTLPVSCGICMQLKKQQWELDMEQQTGSK